jgi:two-component system LytT family sensor kinase
MYRLKTFSLILHIAGWFLFLLFPLLIMDNAEGIAIKPSVLLTWPYIQFCLCYILLFYINSYFLIPQFFLLKKYWRYFACVAVLFAGVIYLSPFDRLMSSRAQAFRAREMHRMSSVYGRPFQLDGPTLSQLPPDSGFRNWPPGGPGGKMRPHRLDVNSQLIFVLIMAFSLALRSVEQWQITEKRAILAEADKAIAELSFLKAQINPHFLYNTLNNIYTLSIIGSEKTSDSIMKLSNIMRYVTDEAEADFVPLSSELNCITNFIDLQKLRLGKSVTLRYTITGEPLGHKISPLLLMTFIENVFKYGLSNHEPALINMTISMDEEYIIFHSQNQIFNYKGHSQRSGIGIINTRKRLDHLYAGKYELKINSDNDLFTVDLILRS